MKWLDNIRNKPDSVKNKYAFLGSLTITLFIFMFWLVSFLDRNLSVENQLANPIESFKNTFQMLE
jgi:hypothetical protein